MNRHSSTARSDLESMLIDQTAEPKALPLSLLEEITDGFSDEQEIGQGGFATVYKGVLENGEVAVKRLSKTHMFEKEFHREVKCHMMVRHKNVVRFLGYCADTQGSMERYDGELVMADVHKRLLCFEYLSNGSLDKFITGASTGLDWRNRYKIIEGIVEGLHCLHEKSIVHLDLKPANILLDDNMVPKIADFGLSRCFPEQQTQIMASKIGGTFGYTAPECGNGVITRRFDIYSLGVIIIELLKGQKGYHAVENVETDSGGLHDGRLMVIRETTSEINSSTSKELIKVDPEIHFPFLPKMSTTCLMKLVNITHHYVGFNIFTTSTNVASYQCNPTVGILPPWSTQQIVVSRLTKEGAVEEIQCKDKYFVWRNVVDKSFNASDLLKCYSIEYCTKIPVVLDKVLISSSSTSNELIKVDPPELHFPFLPSTSVACSVKLVNITPHYVGFNIWIPRENSATYYATPLAEILPPGSTKQIMVRRRAKEGVVQDYDIQCKDKFFVWRTIVDTSVKASDLHGKCFANQHSMEIPLFLDKMPISSFASNEPIQLDPFELRFSFLPNISVTRWVELLNISPYHVIFRVWYSSNTTVALYTVNPSSGMLAPGSRQKLVVSRREKEGTVQDIHCKDNLFVWRNIVNENFNTDIDLSRYFAEECSIKLPIVLTEATEE